MKKFFSKIKNGFAKILPTRRRIIQLYTALLYNANLKGFFTGSISSAGTKNVCVPGFNCYSCPGAVGACPLGSLQNALGSSKTGTISYVLGIIALYGLLLGRTICGFLCPMGLLQDLLYKIKSPKLKKSRITRVLSYFKYVLLAVFVVTVPLAYSKAVTLPAFCQFICPVGLVSGLFFLIHPANAAELVSLGVLFTWKFSLAMLILIAAVFVFRPFCRFFCPLGALYGFFSKIALLGVKLDKQKCIDCGLCVKTCKVDIRKVGDHECIQCGDCVSVCPTQAISWKGGKLFLLPNETNAKAEPVDLMRLVKTPVLAESALVAEVGAPVTEGAASVAMAASAAQIAAPAEVAISPSEPIAPLSAPQKAEKRPPFYSLRKNRCKGFRILAAALAAVVLVSALVYFNFIHKETVAKTSYAVGDVMADFETKEFFSEDGTYSLSEDAGKIVVLNFWYIGCVGCEGEMPHFGALAKDEGYKDKVSVVVVHSSEDVHEPEVLVDYGGARVPYIEKYIMQDKSQSAVEAYRWNTFAGEIKWTMDLAGEDALYLSLGGSQAWPMTAILDEEGKVRFITSSSVTEEILYEEIDKILAE